MAFPEYVTFPTDPYDDLFDSGNIAISGGDPGDLIALNEDSKISPLLLSRFCFNQGVPSTTWTVAHNLNEPSPSVTVVDSLGTEVIGCVVYDNENVLRILFNVPFSGKAYIG